jgi:hypothetical protein
MRTPCICLLVCNNQSVLHPECHHLPNLSRCPWLQTEPWLPLRSQNHKKPRFATDSRPRLLERCLQQHCCLFGSFSGNICSKKRAICRAPQIPVESPNPPANTDGLSVGHLGAVQQHQTYVPALNINHRRYALCKVLCYLLLHFQCTAVVLNCLR